MEFDPVKIIFANLKTLISKIESPPSPTSSVSKEVIDEKFESEELVYQPPPPLQWARSFLSRGSKLDPDTIATCRSVFNDPALAPYYQPKEDYENRHQFDPKARWTYREEQALVCKIDWRVMLWAAISFSAPNLDRSNISQALSDNFLGNLKPATNVKPTKFDDTHSVFRLGFLITELPSQLVGPDRWIPTQVRLLSSRFAGVAVDILTIVTLSQFWLSGRPSFLATRFLLGYVYARRAEPSSILHRIRSERNRRPSA
ncbi:allantoate permease [Mycena alexandri]|uniref:Allantoate permease n=1 Tax=Mycena alexandri TaxID=1745969 RepID=A0AAD6SSB6_9AGAR|nr:allantoate permease [Mycena alexandri]